jgi:hypothetical protein
VLRGRWCACRPQEDLVCVFTPAALSMPVYQRPERLDGCCLVFAFLVQMCISTRAWLILCGTSACIRTGMLWAVVANRGTQPSSLSSLIHGRAEGQVVCLSTPGTPGFRTAHQLPTSCPCIKHLSDLRDALDFYYAHVHQHLYLAELLLHQHVFTNMHAVGSC